MGLTGVFDTYAYNEAAARWMGGSGFVSEAAIRDELAQLSSAMQADLESLTRAFYRGELTGPQWQAAVMAELKDAHGAQAMLARGGRAGMGSQEWGRVGGNLSDEYRHLSRMLEQIASGEVTEAQALARIRQYGQATQQAYWREFSRATPAGQMVYWDLNPGESCPDCMALAAGSPYKPGELPTHPGAGQTRCHGNCNCALRRGSE